MPAQRHPQKQAQTDPVDASSPGKAVQPSGRSRKRLGKGLTCANCRERKTRCDGGQPGCKTCEVYGVACRYDRMPPLTQIMDLARRLQEAESTIETMRRQISSSASPGANPIAATRAQTDQSQEEEKAQTGYHTGSGYNTPAELAEMDGGDFMDAQLSIDANGQLSYHGPTSSVHQPITHLPSPRDELQLGTSVASAKEDVRRKLTNQAMEVRTWEDLALGNAALRTQIPVEAVARLLKLHWTWIAPQFLWIHRPSFMRDMMCQGPYFSDLLLTVVCAHAARYQQDSKIRDLLTARAELLLGQEIIKPSAVPTAQALLQLSARETAFGRFSQAWMYSGMAFRMVSDLGLQHSHGRLLSLGSLDSEDLEIRRRLFWSCYFWDKTLSLYIGRMPVLVDTPFGHAPELLDVSSETEMWSPMYSESSYPNEAPLPPYPPQQSHAPSCFANACKLAVIINDIMQKLYFRRQKSPSAHVLRDIQTRLDLWRSDLPSHLRCDPEYPPALSPPPHILTLNLLYYTTLILLHRPFYSSASHRAICRHAAFDLEKLLDILVKTFGYSHITYLQAYCIYTAASVLVKDYNSGDSIAKRKMHNLLLALHGGLKTCPILQRSIDIIETSLHGQEKMLEATLNSAINGNSIGPEPVALDLRSNVPPQPNWSFERDIVASIPPTFNTSPSSQSQTAVGLPAFPFLHSQMSQQLDSTMDNNADLFSMLDSFPETSMSQLQGEELMSWLQE